MHPADRAPNTQKVCFDWMENSCPGTGAETKETAAATAICPGREILELSILFKRTFAPRLCDSGTLERGTGTGAFRTPVRLECRALGHPRIQSASDALTSPRLFSSLEPTLAVRSIVQEFKAHLLARPSQLWNTIGIGNNNTDWPVAVALAVYFSTKSAYNKFLRRF